MDIEQQASRTPGVADPFHSCWYPVALSSEIAPGKLMGAAFLGGRVVIYRSERGVAQVLSAYCRHLGADLSVGEVIGENVQCAFHHWQYAGNGQCALIPAGDVPPPAARLYSYPTAESLGVIWAFNGKSPTYPVPAFSDVPVATDTFRNPLIMSVASDVVFLNSFDIQHFRVVHGLQIEVDTAAARREDFRYHYTAEINAPEFGAVRQERTLWGVSTVTIESMRSSRKMYLLHALCPNTRNSTTGFLVNALGPDPAGADPSRDRALLDDMRAYSLRLVAEDAPIFNTIRFSAGCLTRSDRFLAFGLSYVDSFPATNPGAALLCGNGP
jgi:nitrite reductase/ring-hydroxylating ferredoxin subunit